MIQKERANFKTSSLRNFLKLNYFTNEDNDLDVEYIKRIMLNFGNTVIIVDYYGNSIPLGSFCNAISFILTVFKDVIYFLMIHFCVV